MKELYNAVLTSGMVPLLQMLSMSLQRRAIQIVDDTIVSKTLESLQLRRDVAYLSVFYELYHVIWRILGFVIDSSFGKFQSLSTQLYRCLELITLNVQCCMTLLTSDDRTDKLIQCVTLMQSYNNGDADVNFCRVVIFVTISITSLLVAYVFTILSMPENKLIFVLTNIPFIILNAMSISINTVGFYLMYQLSNRTKLLLKLTKKDVIRSRNIKEKIIAIEKALENQKQLRLVAICLESFSWPIACRILLEAMQYIINIYSLILVFSNYRNIYIYPYLLVFNVFYIIWHTVITFLIVNPSYTYTQMDEKLTNYLHELVLKIEDFSQECVKHFYIALQGVRKSAVNFQPFSIFDLNRKVFTNIGAFLSIYLVLLIQLSKLNTLLINFTLLEDFGIIFVNRENYQNESLQNWYMDI